MAAVTQRINHYLGGVSKQSDSKKQPGQVTECINGNPDPTFGLTKRPGFKYIDKLETTGGADFTGTQLDNAKWFYIHRQGDERYVGCVTNKVDATLGNVYVWNATTGAACTVHYDAKPWVASTAYVVGDRVTNDSGKVYTCDTAGTSAGSGGPTGTGANISDNTARWDYLSASVARSYLTSVAAISDYNVLTVHDTSILTNTTTTVAALAAPTFVPRTRATLVLNGAPADDDEYDVTINDGSSDHTISTITATASSTYDSILTSLKTAIAGLSITGITSGDLRIFQNSLQIDRIVTGTRTTFSITASGGSTNKKMYVFQDWVDSAENLSSESIHDHVVEVINTSQLAEDNYYGKFVADNETIGRGYWMETIAPTVSTGLDQATMPHELINTEADVFILKQVDWNSRIVGDDVTNPHPSFVGKKLQHGFFYSNRLGFLADNKVVFSKANKFYDFYKLTARLTVDSDRIDHGVETIRPAILNAALPTTQGVVLFSNQQQFLLTGPNGLVTPASIVVKSIANMEVDSNVHPVDMGTHIHFISKTPNYTRAFGMLTRGYDEPPQILDVSRVVNEWISPNIDTLIANPQNQFLALSDRTDDKLYVYRTYSDGKETKMQAWSYWQLPGNVQTVSADQDDLYAVTKQNNQYILSSANLSQSPDQAIIVDNQGNRVNPCVDLYTQLASSSITYKNVTTITITAGGTGYSSPPTVAIAAPVDTNGVTATATATISAGAVNSITITNKGSAYQQIPAVTFSGGGGSNAAATAAIDAYDGSKCYLPYADTTTLTPIIVVAGSTAAGTFVESGFTITPERDSDGTGPFFKVPQKDLSKSNDLVVGYKYDYDVTLPQTYFKTDEDRNDYTASLTIARMKFAVGLSGIMSFKLKSTGRLSGSKTYTGDGATKDFNWIDADIDYVDRDQVKVKIDNVVNTDWTFLSDTQLRFTTAPADGTTISIYLDEWYSLNPTLMGNTYLANDVPLDNNAVYTLPIHQKNDNFTLRIFNDSPFPVSLNSMMWEGRYSPRFYRRT